MKRILTVLWYNAIQVFTMITLFVCSMYLFTKAVIHYQINEVLTSFLLIGVGFIVYYIHKELFKTRR